MMYAFTTLSGPLNRKIESGILRDVAERKEVHRQLATAEAERRATLASLDAEIEARRQVLTAIDAKIGVMLGIESAARPVAAIQRAVADHFGIAIADLLAHRRLQAFTMPRHIAMYLAARMTPMSLPAIGRLFSGRDHTTVLHAVRSVEKKMKENPQIAEAVASLRAAITTGGI